eukprot:NP_493267.2 F-box A protein [Caenorhabditis elegans]
MTGSSRGIVEMTKKLDRLNSKKRPLTLLSMPVDVMEKVMKKVDPYDWISVRNSNRNLRDFVDSQHLKLDIDVSIEGTFHTIDINGNQSFGPFHPVVADDERRTIYNKRLQFALRKLFVVMKLPSAQIEEFKLDFDFMGRGSDEFEDIYDIGSRRVSFKNKLLSASLRTIDKEFGEFHCFQAKSVSLSGLKEPRTVLILKSFKSGTLENIEIINSYKFYFSWQLTLSEQWKNAKKLKTGLSTDRYTGIRVAELFAFSNIEFTTVVLSSDLKVLVDSSAKLETCLSRNTYDSEDDSDEDSDEDSDDEDNSGVLTVSKEVLKVFDPNFVGYNGTINYKANGFEYLIEVTEFETKIVKKIE